MRTFVRVAMLLLAIVDAVADENRGVEAVSIKRIPLTSDGNARLSLGGQVRERFEYFSEPFFGLREVEQDQYLLHRLLFNADLQAGDHVRVFIEFGNHLQGGKRAARAPTDVDEFDLQQSFVDLTVPFDKQSRLLLRAGRQELNLGSARLVSVREGANIRRSFDGARMTFTMGKATFDAFALRTVNLKVGALNDDSNRHEALWGGYAVLPLPALKDSYADLYYLGLERDGAVFEQGTADEQRHSFGTRFWGKASPWDYNVEAVFQCGSFGEADILAWTVATDAGYTLTSLRFRPRLGLKADIASGDRDASDDRLTTFNALFPKQPYFSEASIIAPANIIDLHPSLSLELSDRLALTLDWDFFWKHRAEDAIYAPPGRPLAHAGKNGGRYIGNQVNIEIGWDLTPNVSWTFYYSHFFAGSAVTEAGGRDVDFLGSWLTFRF